MKLILLVTAVFAFLLAAIGATVLPNPLAWGLFFLACSFLPLPPDRA